jgi:hypothetical protein
MSLLPNGTGQMATQHQLAYTQGQVILLYDIMSYFQHCTVDELLKATDENSPMRRIALFYKAAYLTKFGDAQNT